VDTETDPEAYSADLSRPSVKATLAVLGVFRLAVAGIGALAEYIAGLAIVGWLLAHGQVGAWKWRREDDEVRVGAALAATGTWAGPEQIRRLAGLTSGRSKRALRRLVESGAVEDQPTASGDRRYRRIGQRS
jgi:hypothetical protein